jgi:hypothetical protein
MYKNEKKKYYQQLFSMTFTQTSLSLTDREAQSHDLGLRSNDETYEEISKASKCNIM